MYLSEELQSKWAPVLSHDSMPDITDPYRKSVTAVLLENQEQSARENGGWQYLSEGNFTAVNGDDPGSAGVDNFDPVLISLVRRAMPNLIAYDICGVQPMTGPTGLIFAMRAHYGNDVDTDGAFAPGANEALFDEANTAFSARGTPEQGPMDADTTTCLLYTSPSPRD